MWNSHNLNQIINILSEIEDVFEKLDVDENCRVIILTGEGKAFSSGLDLKGNLLHNSYRV